jgi:hypothetical protein
MDKNNDDNDTGGEIESPRNTAQKMYNIDTPLETRFQHAPKKGIDSKHMAQACTCMQKTLKHE